MHITRNRNTETRSNPAVTRHIHSYFCNKILPYVLALSIDAAITDLLRMEFHPRQKSKKKIKIGSIILRLEFINGMLVNLEVPDDVVNTMLKWHDATKRIEARYNSHISAHNGYQASLDRTGRRGRPAFIITAKQLTSLLEHSATEDRILPPYWFSAWYF